MPQAGVCVLASLISGVSAALILASGPSYTEAHSPQGTAHKVIPGQSTYNGCRANSCQTAYVNSVEDFCLWAPSQPALPATRNTEHALDAWCIKSTRGARLIPDGTISGARLVITPEYVQITGVGNLTNINVPADGVASASGEGDHVHGLVFTRAYGQLEQIDDWTSFVSQERFCFRACKPFAAACPRIYDSFGCLENVPGDYDTGAFEDYTGTEVPLTLHQEVLAAPSHHSTRQPSGCTTCRTMNNAQAARARRAIVSMSGSTLSTLVTSFSHPGSRTQSTPLTSSIVPATTDIATTITFPSFAASTLTTTTSMSFSTPVSSATPMSAPYSRSYTHTHSNWHSQTQRHSRHHSSTSSVYVSSSSSHHSFSHSRSSSSIAYSPSSFGESSTTSLASSTPSFTSTPSTYSSSDPSSSGTSTPTSTPTLAPTPSSTSSFPFSSDGMSSSLSSLSSAQPSSSIPSSAVPPTSSLTPSPIPSLASSQSSDVSTFTTSLSSSSLSTTSPAISSSALPNSQTQIGSQCPPPLQVAVNAGSIVPPPAPLSLMLTILMIVISSSVTVLVP